jgi:hypothetical protein
VIGVRRVRVRGVERMVKTASGARRADRAVELRGSREIEHLGSAHDEAELEALKAAERQRLAAGLGELHLGLEAAAASGTLPIVRTRLGFLWDALSLAVSRFIEDRTGGTIKQFVRTALPHRPDPRWQPDPHPEDPRPGSPGRPRAHLLTRDCALG